MVHFRIWPTAAAGVAVLATSAIATAGPTPTDTGSLRPAPPVRRPVTALVRHPVAAVANRSTAVVPRISQDADDNRLLTRIDRINRENCTLAMRERPAFDASILAGIIDQRRAECMRQRFNPRPASARFRDADDHRLNAGRIDDRRDDRQISRSRFDDRRFNAARFDDRRDDRQVSRLRFDDRQISRARFDRDDRRAVPARFATAARFRADRRFAASRVARPMGRPRP